MPTRPVPICTKHKVPKEWRPTTFEYAEAAVTIRVPNIYAWVCPESGEASFLPKTVDELVYTVRDLLKAAKRTQERQSMPTEYNILVGRPVPLEAAAL